MNAAQAVPVASVGFGWTPILLSVANLLLGGVLIAIIKSQPALRRIKADREANLLNERAEEMDKLRERIEKLEQKLEEKDAKFADALAL